MFFLQVKLFLGPFFLSSFCFLQSSLKLLDLLVTLFLSFDLVLSVVFDLLLSLLQLLLQLCVLALKLQVVLFVLGDGLGQLRVVLGCFFQ